MARRGKSNLVRNEDGLWINVKPFKKSGETFFKRGYYIPDPKGSIGYTQFWKEEHKRFREGYSVGGVKITGDHYFYMNYAPIKKADIEGGTASKIVGMPDFWDGDYNYFIVREIARYGLPKKFFDKKTYSKWLKLKDEKKKLKLLEEEFDKLGLYVKIEPDYLTGGYNLIIGKARRKGFSYKNSAIAVKNLITKPKSRTILAAYESKYLYPAGLFAMAYDTRNFINANTAFSSPADVVDKASSGHVRNSYIQYQDGVKVEKGFQSDIISYTLKDNPDVLRGKDGEDIFFEEAGAFGTPGLLKKGYSASKDTVMAGTIQTGLITIFGCVCKGTEVWDNKGRRTTIENITKDTGILGYSGNGVIEEKISWIKPPGKKECVRIETEKGYHIECSTDHPLLVKSDKKEATFKLAGDIKEGDRLLQIGQIPKFGDKRMWNPRVVGLMIGDGYYGTEYSSGQLAVSEKEILNYLDSIGIKYSVYNKKSSTNPFFRYITLKLTQKEFRLLGIQGQPKKEKRLPNNIWEYRKEDVAEMLGGYFDADGYIGVQGKRKKISLVSLVKELLEEVQTQLYKFDIHSNIYKRNHKKGTQLKSNVTGKTSIINTTESYSLEICDLESIRNFKKHIGFIVKHKQELLDSFNLDKKSNEKSRDYKYVKTIDKGKFFESNPKLNNLISRKVEKVKSIGLQDVYNLTADYTHTYITNGFISHNTSGDLDKGTVDYADMMMKPLAYKLLPFQNVWDEELDMKVGYFHPVNWNMEGFYDENGNSDIEGAKAYELANRELRKRHGATSIDIIGMKQERPLGPIEAFGNVSDNMFPILELNRQLRYLNSINFNTTQATPIEFVREKDGKVKAIPIFNDNVEPIQHLKNIPTNIRGVPIIFEAPKEGGVYYIGYDPVRQDEGSSLAAIIVYKAYRKGTGEKGEIVAEYYGRRDITDDMNRIAEFFADYYGAKIMYENNVKDVKTYFRKIRRLNLLALQPDNVISKHIKNSKVNRGYGCHMDTQLKTAALTYIKDWLLSSRGVDDNGKEILNLYSIKSTRLLEELINYNSTGNFDAISAFAMVMIQQQENILEITGQNKNVDKQYEELKNIAKNLMKNKRRKIYI